MAKMIDHKFLRKAAQGIIDHLGTEEDGENPNLPDPDDDLQAAGQHSTADLKPLGSAKPKGADEGSAKKKNSAMALLASNLASKFNK